MIIHSVKVKPNSNDDMKRFKYVKRLLRKYKETGELKERLILNHLIVIFNVFEPDARFNATTLQDRTRVLECSKIIYGILEYVTIW